MCIGYGGTEDDGVVVRSAVLLAVLPASEEFDSVKSVSCAGSLAVLAVSLEEELDVSPGERGWYMFPRVGQRREDAGRVVLLLERTAECPAACLVVIASQALSAWKSKILPATEGRVFGKNDLVAFGPPRCERMVAAHLEADPAPSWIDDVHAVGLVRAALELPA